MHPLPFANRYQLERFEGNILPFLQEFFGAHVQNFNIGISKFLRRNGRWNLHLFFYCIDFLNCAAARIAAANSSAATKRRGVAAEK